MVSPGVHMYELMRGTGPPLPNSVSAKHFVSLKLALLEYAYHGISKCCTPGHLTLEGQFSIPLLACPSSRVFIIYLALGDKMVAQRMIKYIAYAEG